MLPWRPRVILLCQAALRTKSTIIIFALFNPTRTNVCTRSTAIGPVDVGKYGDILRPDTISPTRKHIHREESAATLATVRWRSCTMESWSDLPGTNTAISLELEQDRTLIDRNIILQKGTFPCTVGHTSLTRLRSRFTGCV
jgi:hypothetical protein